MLVPFAFGASVLVGTCSHVMLFIHGEWEPKLQQIPVTYAGIEVLLAAWLVRLFGLFSSTSWTCFVIINIGYFTGLFGSIIVYRVFFHKLRTFPGPLAAGITVFWSAYKYMPHFQFHKVVEELHDKHGDFVRIRPREISIRHVDAVLDIHGHGSVFLKGPFYDINLPARSLQMTRDKSFHSQRRRIWDRGFTASALSGYQPRVTEHCLKLISRLSAQVGQPVNIAKWTHFFGFDVMGDLAFGKSFDMIDTEGDHSIIALLSGTEPAFGLMMCVPWLFTLFQKLPFVSQKRMEWLGWCGDQVRERRKVGQSRKDLFSYILGEDAVNINEGDLLFDSELAILAGSYSTSLTIATLMFLLAKNPEKLKVIQDEIDNLFLPDEALSYQKLSQETPLLEGCINETLRLYPAVPSGMPRVTPPEGAKIAGRWIPGDTIVSTPTYAIHRDPRYFERPEEFIPERWLPQSELKHNRNAFHPFLIGSYSCVGKTLALMEIRLLMYYILKDFSFNFVPGAKKEVHDVFDSTQGYRDYGIARGPAFDLVFSRRE